MPYDSDQIDNLDAELDDLDSPTSLEVLHVSDDYDPAIVAASAVQRAINGGGGGGGSEPPVTLTGTDPAQAVLTIQAAAGQSESIFQAFDENGDLKVDIDNVGRLDATVVTVQDPPLEGTPNQTVSIHPSGITIGEGTLDLSDNGTDDLFLLRDRSVGNVAVIRIKSPGHGDLFEISPSLDTDVPIQVILSPSTSVNVIEVWDNPFNTLLFAVTNTGGIQATLPTANPGPGLLWNDSGTVKVGT